MAPKSEDPDLTPLTPEAKACRNRRKSDTLLQKDDAEGKGKPTLGMRTRTRGGNSKDSLHVQKPPTKKRRGMRRRISSNKLAGLTATTLGCLNSHWTKKKRSNTPIRRGKLSGYAAPVRAHNETVLNNDLEENIIYKDSLVDAGIEKIISLGDSLELQPPLKVYERRKNDSCVNKMKGDGDSLNLQTLKVYKRHKNRSSSFTIPAPRSVEEEDDCDGMNSPVVPETQVIVDEPAADNQYSSSFTILAPRSMEEEDDCDGMNGPVIPETQVTVDETIVDNHFSSPFTILTPRCMEEEDDCEGMNSPVIPETQVTVDETIVDNHFSSPFTILAPRSMEEEDDCDVMNSPLIPETQVIVDETIVDNHYSSSFTIQATRSTEEEGDCDVMSTRVILEDLDLGSEADEMPVEFKENNMAWSLTPPIQRKLGDSEKDSGSSETRRSNNQDGLIPSVTTTDSAPSNCGEGESMIDILKKKSENCVVKSPNKRKKMKRHNPKVADPSPFTHKPQTPKLAKIAKKKVDTSKPCTPCTPKPRTPKVAKKVENKVVPSVDENGEADCKRVVPSVDENGEVNCKRKRNARRKLVFDEECSTMEQEILTQDLLSGLQSQRIRKKRSMRKRASQVVLNNLFRSTRERLSSAYISAPAPAPSKLDPSKLDEEGLRAERVKAVIASEPHTKIRQDNVLLIPDELFFEAAEDFLTEKMKSLNIVDDGRSNQLVVQHPNKCGALVLSRMKRDRKKGPIPNVELDEETLKVWDLLMDSTWSEAAEAEALGNDEYMKGERKLFRERLERLNSRMRAVHGSREFKPWKGSVLDSIVGVFLTQNVGDHTSSSAFMTLRARYPPLSLSEQNALYCREDEQLMTIEPSKEHSPVIQEVMAVELSNTTSKEHSPEIQVEQPIEKENEPVPETPKAIQVEQPIEKENEPVPETPKATKGTKKGNGKKKKEKENEPVPETPKATKGTKKGNGKKKKEKEVVDWDLLRKQYSQGMSRERTEQNADTVNWEAIRQASEKELASVILDRGMNNQLAGRIKCFLNRMVKDHGSLDLEWLRHFPPLEAKDFLMSISGLAIKSTECVRLLALHFPAFPVDTNAGRLLVRLGWVPLKPLPEDVQLHLLNQYPVLDSIQMYIWPRVCDNGHPLLYESHCHSITLAKSFCTKTKPNCNECPMRDECNHFASAHASAKLRLEGPEPKSNGDASTSQEAPMVTNVDGNESIDQHTSRNSEPIIEFPPSPVAEPVPMEPLDGDIEDIGCDSEITTIRLNAREFSKNLLSFVGEDDEILKALVPLDPRLGSVPIPKHKVTVGLRTVHQVYELPDSHPLLHTFDKREPDDPCPYLLAIWTTDNEKETAPCDAGSMCLSEKVIDHYQKQGTVKGTILIPCLTANRGAFPLNGTYFQPHEVFADDESSRRPIDVPREWIWNLNRRFLYCGVSVASICKGMSIQEAAYSFQRSAMCIRGFDRKTRYPRTLANRFHLCKSRPANKCE